MAFERELEFAKEKIREASDILLRCYNSGIASEKKSDDTLVTSVDREVSDFLFRELKGRFPDYCIIDEEKSCDLEADNYKKFFVTDPLDSTRGFLKKEGDFGIIIGILHGKKARLGVTYKPLTGELAYAVEGQGAYLETWGTKRKLMVNDKNDLEILVSNTRSSDYLNKIISELKPKGIKKMGGSLKIVEIAKGTSNVFITLQSSVMHLWDLCGTSIILEEAGGKITDIYGNPLKFSPEETANTKGLIASNKVIHQKIIDVVNKLHASFYL